MSVLRRWSLAVSVVLLAVLTLSACSSDEPGHGAGAHHGGADLPSGVNRADVMFTSMMIPHHEQAIEMSDVLLAKDGIDPDVASLAERIKQAQGPEIEQMQQWLDDWDTGMDGDMGDGMGEGHGAGMMGEDDLVELEQAEGEAASRLFLRQMIEHHEGAIEMARDEVADGRSPDVVGLAGSIVATQTLEIEQMNELLESL